jgi:hypothetical protein
MHQDKREVFILKPTAAFLVFLSNQAPGLPLPTLKSLQKNCTAYIINRQEDDEATLNEIERHFVSIFKHEITRCLGADVAQDLHASFLDFLCCFKFELHTHLLIEENSQSEKQYALRVKPRSVMLGWVREVLEDCSDTVLTVDRISLSHLTDNATVVIKSFQSEAEVAPFLEKHYQTIFKAEMSRIHENKEDWPSIYSYEDFKNYFSTYLHTQLISL